MNTQYMLRSFLLILFFLPSLTYGQSVLGTWATYDDVTGEKKSHVEIYERNGKIYGKIIQLFLGPEDPEDPKCKECDEDDPRYNQRIMGMEIIQGLEKDGDEYADGTVLDPENGSVYKCKLWIEGENLVLRGYIGFSLLGRSQTWKPAN